MDNLRDLLSNKDFDEPPEISAIKRFVEIKFHSDVAVRVSPQAIIITAASGALAGTLRMHSLQIQQAAASPKKLIFRIGRVD